MRDRLTPRQIAICAAVARGRPNKVIAHDLGIGVGTVKAHIAAVMQAHGGVASRVQLALWFLATCPDVERVDILQAALPTRRAA